MPSASEEYAGEWLSHSDLKGKRVSLTIESCVRTEFPGKNGEKDETKLVLSFHGKDKKLSLNKTNCTAIIDLHGDDYDEWAGKPVSFFPTKVPFGNEQVDAIRVYQPVPEAADSDSVPF